MTHDKGELESLRNGFHHPKIIAGELDKPMTPLQPKPLGEQPKAVRRQEFMVLLINIGILACGIGLGLPTVTLNQLSDPNELVHLDKSQASWFAAIASITSPIGALMAAMVMDKIGRKTTVIVVNLFAIASWALMAFALQEDSQSVYYQLLLSRCLIGITMGMGSAPSGLYGAEISLAKIRGRLILGVSISIASGILLVYTLGYFIRTDWHLMAGILLVFQVTSLLLLIPVIETPSWLMSKGRAKEAKASLYYFRGIDADQTHPEVEAEFAVLLKNVQLRTGEKKTPFLRSLRKPEIYKPLSIIIGLFVCQQFSGIFVVIVYAVQISIEAGVNIDPILCAVLIGIARVVSTVAMSSFLEKFGRRKAGMFSATGMAICMLLLAATTWFPSLHIPYLPAALIVIYIITSTLGIFTLPFFMNSEVFPQKVRGACAGLTGSFGFLMSFIVIKVYPSMRDFMGAENVFALYGLISIVTVFFVYFILPETKGKSLMEIEEYFRYGKKGIPQEELKVEMGEVLATAKTYT